MKPYHKLRPKNRLLLHCGGTAIAIGHAVSAPWCFPSLFSPWSPPRRPHFAWMIRDLNTCMKHIQPGRSRDSSKSKSRIGGFSSTSLGLACQARKPPRYPSTSVIFSCNQSRIARESSSVSIVSIYPPYFPFSCNFWFPIWLMTLGQMPGYSPGICPIHQSLLLVLK